MYNWDGGGRSVERPSIHLNYPFLSSPHNGLHSGWYGACSGGDVRSPTLTIRVYAICMSRGGQSIPVNGACGPAGSCLQGYKMTNSPHDSVNWGCIGKNGGRNVWCTVKAK